MERRPPRERWRRGVGGFGCKRGRARLRSRNRVIDEGLADEDGHDAYADLEGFIVD